MTKRLVSIRVDADTLAAVDAAGGPRQRSATIEAWLAAQAKAQAANAAPLEQQAWYRAGELVAQANDAVDRACVGGPMTTWQHGVIAALGYLADAVEVLAGTAPE